MSVDKYLYLFIRSTHIEQLEKGEEWSTRSSPFQFAVVIIIRLNHEGTEV